LLQQSAVVARRAGSFPSHLGVVAERIALIIVCDLVRAAHWCICLCASKLADGQKMPSEETCRTWLTFRMLKECFKDVLRTL
jgi:hypothetical protein